MYEHQLMSRLLRPAIPGTVPRKRSYNEQALNALEIWKMGHTKDELETQAGARTTLPSRG